MARVRPGCRQWPQGFRSAGFPMLSSLLTIERLHPPKQMTVQRAVCRLLDTRSEATTASQPKNKMACQPRSPREKRETAATFGRVMSSVTRQPGGNIEALRVFTASSCHCLSLGKRYALLPAIAPSFHHLSLSFQTSLSLSLPASRDVL